MTTQSSGSILARDHARIFFDGTMSEPRLEHPECVAVHRDGSVWCGGERGQIYRIDADGSAINQVASTDGWCLGIAFDANDDLYVCDLKHAAVMHVDTKSGQVQRFADGVGGRAMQTPNYPVVTGDHIYVSDSGAADRPGPGIYRFSPEGRGELWYREPLHFANGLALSRDGRHVYVAETFASAISRIEVNEDGSAGAYERVAAMPGALPDGLVFDDDENLYVGCYEPSTIFRIRPDGTVESLLHDPEAHLLSRPTNLAIRGDALLASNLGRWHVTEIDLAAARG